MEKAGPDSGFSEEEKMQDLVVRDSPPSIRKVRFWRPYCEVAGFWFFFFFWYLKGLRRPFHKFQISLFQGNVHVQNPDKSGGQ